MPRLVKRSEKILYLNTTPKEGTNWSLYGKKTTSSTTSYNASQTTETYIVDDNATVTLDSYNVSIDGNMKCYLGDAVYDYIDDLRYKLAIGDDATTQALLIDKYKVVSEKTFRAQVFDCTIAIASDGGDGGVIPTITFSIGLNGTPKLGTVTFDESGKPVFAETEEI